MMKKVHSINLIVSLVVAILVLKGDAIAKEWLFPLALSYVHGFSDVVDLYEENLEAEGLIVYDISSLPVGVSFHPFIQFDNGLRAGTGIGPIMVILSDYASHFELPINLNAGYTFNILTNLSLYARTGIMYHIVSGEYVKKSNPGIFGAVGMMHKFWDFGAEIGYDASEVKFRKIDFYGNDTESIKPIGLMISLFWFF
ncbi:MAG: hypothetical protein SVR08_14890 [Spirochaetota bacterium]|nr:hypothetical protein [Spirochaetota bacterium]